MAYTFGAATTDAVTHSMAFSPWGATRTSFTCGWFYPTTLTATRKLFGSGATAGVEIDATTTNLRLRTDNTTDGQWTAPAGLAVNTWTFVAVLFDSNSTTGQGWAVWTGTPDTTPINRTVTVATTPVGNIVSPTASVAVGNAVSGSLAFQGDIGGFICIVDTRGQHLGVLNQPLSGTVQNLDGVNRNFVEPAWRGDVSNLGGYGRGRYGYTSGAHMGVMAISPMDFNPTFMRPTTISGYQAATVSGATLSTRRTPHPLQTTYDNHPRRPRRGGYQTSTA